MPLFEALVLLALSFFGYCSYFILFSMETLPEDPFSGQRYSHRLRGEPPRYKGLSFAGHQILVETSSIVHDTRATSTPIYVSTVYRSPSELVQDEFGTFMPRPQFSMFSSPGPSHGF